MITTLQIVENTLTYVYAVQHRPASLVYKTLVPLKYK